MNRGSSEYGQRVIPLHGCMEIRDTLDQLGGCRRQPARPSLIDAGREGGGRLTRWWGLMFLLFCGGAFLMMVGAVLGARMASAAYAQQAVRGNAISAILAPVGFKAPSVVNDVEPQHIVGETEPASAAPEQLEGLEITGDAVRRHARETLSRTRPDGRERGNRTREGKNLSEHSRAMLERMGAGADLVPSEALSRKADGEEPEGLRPEQLYRVVSGGKRQLQRCYETALRYTVSDETIRLDVGMTVGMSGAVTRVKIRGRTLGDMDACIESAIRTWIFPAAGRATDTAFPLIFQPGR